MHETVNNIIDEINKVFPANDKATSGSRLGLTIEFFIVFSRMEYALKNSPFLKSDPRKEEVKIKMPDGPYRAEADWTGFAKDEAVSKCFEALTTPNSKVFNPKVACAYDFYTNPHTLPKKQIVMKGALDWSEGGNAGDKRSLEKALTLVCRARNNLFHGSKFTTPEDDPFRNQNLLIHGITILKAVMPLNDAVEEAYNRTINIYQENSQ